MEYIKCEIEGPVVIRPAKHNDARGYFMETFRLDDFKKNVAETTFVQENESCSTKGVIRGLHFQAPPYAQAKLVRCVKGRVLDVAVDIRAGSPTYGKFVAVELSEDNNTQLFIPRGFAHGFSVLSDVAVFQYKCDYYYAPQAEGGISILDKTIGIDWGLNAEESILSEKDTKHPELKDFISPFKY